MLRGVERSGRNPMQDRRAGCPHAGNLDMAAIAGHLKSIGFRRLSFRVAGWEDHTGICWTDEDMEALERAREAFFPFFLESALRGEPEVDMGFAALVAAGPDGPAGLCECGSGEVYIDTQARIHRAHSMRRGGPRSAAAIGSVIAGKRTCRPAEASTRIAWPAGPGPAAAGAAWSATSAAPGLPHLILPKGKGRGAIFSGRSLRGRRSPTGFSKAAVPGAQEN
jgi:hypothetical protein